MTRSEPRGLNTGDPSASSAACGLPGQARAAIHRTDTSAEGCCTGSRRPGLQDDRAINYQRTRAGTYCPDRPIGQTSADVNRLSNPLRRGAVRVFRPGLQQPRQPLLRSDAHAQSPGRLNAGAAALGGPLMDAAAFAALCAVLRGATQIRALRASVACPLSVALTLAMDGIVSQGVV